MRVVYDIETYPNCITIAAEHADLGITWSFEISEFTDERQQLFEWFALLMNSGADMVGYNNVGFDYPVLHLLLTNPKATVKQIYNKAMQIIKSHDNDDKFANMVYPSDRYVPQIDLFKIHHFDNFARSTSLKALEFNMRMDNISDLPFPVGTHLNPEQIAHLKKYNAHDVTATKLFYHKSLEQIRFREELTTKHSIDFMNHNDVKIGKQIFQMELEAVGVQCYTYGKQGRQPAQSLRPQIALKDCIPDYIHFNDTEFNRVKQWMEAQIITETKGVFKDVIANVGGLEFIFGTGGLHASVDCRSFNARKGDLLVDIDVTSLYPSIAIENHYYPEHLGEVFVDVYSRLKEQRVSYAKGTAENAMLKLALNGVYGASNDKFSVFFDPLFTMKITITGQLVMAMLAERLIEVGAEIIQCNTDGITMMIFDTELELMREVCAEWEKLTHLSLESVDYSAITIRDVNNYIAVGTNGKVKRKGAYEHQIEWHQNGSCLVVPMVAEQVIVYNKPLLETLMNWPNKLDFMLRAKAPRNSKLVLNDGVSDSLLENTQRYYVSTEGGSLVKIMPPLKGKTEDRRFNISAGYKVCPCNDINDAVLPINYKYYMSEIEKLTLGVL